MIFYAGLAAVLLSCSEGQPTVPPRQGGEVTAQADTSNRQALAGARFSDTITVTALLPFSDPEKPDKFQLVVPAGPLAVTKARISIRANGQIVYTDSFDTRYFTKFIWNPDTVPAALSGEAYEQYLLQFSRSLSREEVERRTWAGIINFFNDISFTPSELKAIAKYGNMTYSEFYAEISRDSTRRIVVLPCFSCEAESRCYLTYLPKEKRVLSLVVADQ